jgi:hypothetical protein
VSHYCWPRVGRVTGSGQSKYQNMTLSSGPGCTEVHGSCDQPGGRGRCPVCAAGTGVGRVRWHRPGPAVPGGPDARGSARPRAAHTRRRPGTRTTAGPRFRPGGAGVGGCRAPAGSRSPAREEPDRVIPVAGPAGPALPSPGRVNHVWTEPGEMPAFRLPRPRHHHPLMPVD